jgi:glyoxalase family protein
MPKLNGLHHVTAVASNARKTVDFYCNILGLQLIKQTVNFDEPSILHLYCGPGDGVTASLLAFYIYPDGAAGRCGTGQVSAITFSVPQGSFDHWRQKLTRHGVPLKGQAWAFGEEYLCFTDPDGLELAMIEKSIPTAGAEYAVTGIRSVEIRLRGFEHASQFLVDTLGMTIGERDGAVVRFYDGPATQPIAVDVLCMPTRRHGAAGPGVPDHVAWRVSTTAQLKRMRARLVEDGVDVSIQLDRLYFSAIYFEAPGGVQFAIATDHPGFTVDEPATALGHTLCLPPWLARQRPAITRQIGPSILAALPPYAAGRMA